MERSVVRKMPDGSTRRVEPYHVCLKGLETAILCRDDEDYDVMVKVLAVCARRHNVIIVTYSVVSNHTHAAALAAKTVKKSIRCISVTSMVKKESCDESR